MKRTLFYCLVMILILISYSYINDMQNIVHLLHHEPISPHKQQQFPHHQIRNKGETNEKKELFKQDQELIIKSHLKNKENQLNLFKEMSEAPTDPNNDLTTEKKIFLTFDDGPSKQTNKILKILQEKNVKATFFTIGNLMEKKPEIVVETDKLGHTVLPHSYSHDYQIYTNFRSFYEDFYKAQEVYEDILNRKPPKYFRFPGGSSNQVSYRYGGKQFMSNVTTDVKQKGYSYIDWNVYSGDANSKQKKPKDLYQQTITGTNNKNLVVALFHDAKANEATVTILPQVIDYFKKNNFQFRTFADITEEELQTMIENGIVNKSIVQDS